MAGIERYRISHRGQTLKMLTEGEERLRQRGVLLWLGGPQFRGPRHGPTLALRETLGRERMLFNLSMAVDRHLERRGVMVVLKEDGA